MLRAHASPPVAFRYLVDILPPPASAALRGYRRARRAGWSLREAADVARRRERENTRVWQGLHAQGGGLLCVREGID